MSLNSYGLSDEQYLELLQEKSKLVSKAFKKFFETALAEGINLKAYDSQFVWNLFQEAGYAADEEARVIQKEQDPEAVKKRSYDYGIVPTREEFMEEIKSIKDLLNQP